MVQVLRPDEVQAKYGPMFCRGFYTLVDEEHGRAQIIEKCVAKGPGEWDIVNRRRTKGVIEDIRMESNMLVMDTIIGERELNFGPVATEMGGQGLKALKIEGDEVRTTWYGIAGASVGIGACIPQCPDVIRTEYPDDFQMGGAHRAHVDIITPKLVRVIIGIDDTDTKEKRIYYNVKLHLMQLRQQGGSTYLGRFTQTDDSLFIYNMVLDGNNAQAATLDDLSPFGLFDTYERFGIEKLTAQRMVLRSRNALLTFRKW